MTGHVLNLDRIRLLYSMAHAWRAHDDIEGGDADLSGLRARQAAEFDEAIAQHDRELIEKLATENDAHTREPHHLVVEKLERAEHVIAAALAVMNSSSVPLGVSEARHWDKMLVEVRRVLGAYGAEEPEGSHV